MARLNEPTIKQLTASGAITTNNKGGRLFHVIVSGDTAGDSVAIKDGATTVLTLLVPANEGSVKWEPPIDAIPTFYTDIDVAITTSNNVYATFIYEELVP